MSLEEYDSRASTDWPHRIPNAGSADLSDRLGDCIYDFASGAPVQRPGVHGPGNVDTDLGGKNVLVSVAARNDDRPDARSRTISDARSLRLKSAPDARSVRLSAN
jgi:hypothetical protein